MEQKLKTNEEFIVKSKMIHGDKYIYDKVVYVNAHTKVEIFCVACDKYFWQIARNHYGGSDCIKCSYKKRKISNRLTQEEFLKRAKEIHGEKYNYDEFIYKTAIIKGKIKCITCNIIFEQDAHHHIAIKKTGCPKCGVRKVTDMTRKTVEQFIEEAKEIHGDKYKYDKVNYKNTNTYIEIYCNKCQILFQQTPASHIRGNGCNNCSCIETGLKLRLTHEDFLEKAIAVHGDKYDYSKTIYVKGTDKINIFCKKCKTEFQIRPNDHINGRNGCSRCKLLLIIT